MQGELCGGLHEGEAGELPRFQFIRQKRSSRCRFLSLLPGHCDLQGIQPEFFAALVNHICFKTLRNITGRPCHDFAGRRCVENASACVQTGHSRRTRWSSIWGEVASCKGLLLPSNG